MHGINTAKRNFDSVDFWGIKISECNKGSIICTKIISLVVSATYKQTKVS